MKRKDSLAAGARSATFQGGVGENDPLRNASKEARMPDPVFAPAPAKPRYQFIPLGDVLLVRQKIAEKSSLLAIDTVEQEKPAEGEVVTVGPLVPLTTGTQVVFGKYAGAEFRLNGEVLLLMKLTDILGTLQLLPPIVMKSEGTNAKGRFKVTPGTKIAEA